MRSRLVGVSPALCAKAGVVQLAASAMTIALRSGLVFRDIREISCFRKNKRPFYGRVGCCKPTWGGDSRMFPFVTVCLCAADVRENESQPTIHRWDVRDVTRVALAMGRGIDSGVFPAICSRARVPASIHAWRGSTGRPGSPPSVDDAQKKRDGAFAPSPCVMRIPPLRDAQVSRNAVVIGKRAARSAGNRPPTRPMPSAHFSPVHSSSGDTWNLNTTALKLLPMVDTL